jgi:hypothetical protein
MLPIGLGKKLMIEVAKSAVNALKMKIVNIAATPLSKGIFEEFKNQIQSLIKFSLHYKKILNL